MYSGRIDQLFSDQLAGWELAGINYRNLSKVRTKRLSFGGFEVFVQFNPARITSSSAKVDDSSVKQRPCFLCADNRPKEQKGIPFGDDMIILINPFPIFRRHLTIPSCSHSDQKISGSFGKMLLLTKAMPRFTVFYNGPQSGASAPDHLHFQAGNSGFMPIEEDFKAGRNTSRVLSRLGLKVLKWEGYHRGIITITGNDAKEISTTFGKIFGHLALLQPERPEPMLNILSCYSGEEWTIHIIPRKKHRPVQFFSPGGDRLLISPASVDLGGVMICPREEDFEKITGRDVLDIFSQVCYNDDEITEIINGIL